MPIKAKVIDPDLGTEVTLEVWKDPRTGGLMGVDQSLMDPAGPSIVPNPYSKGEELSLPASEVVAVP